MRLILGRPTVEFSLDYDTFQVLLIEKIPGPKALPILGNALEVNVNPRGQSLQLTFIMLNTVIVEFKHKVKYM